MKFTFYNSYIIRVPVPSMHSDLLDRAQLLTQMLLKQEYVVSRLTSSI